MSELQTETFSTDTLNDAVSKVLALNDLVGTALARDGMNDKTEKDLWLLYSSLGHQLECATQDAVAHISSMNDQIKFSDDAASEKRQSEIEEFMIEQAHMIKTMNVLLRKYADGEVEKDTDLRETHKCIDGMTMMQKLARLEHNTIRHWPKNKSPLYLFPKPLHEVKAG